MSGPANEPGPPPDSGCGSGLRPDGDDSSPSAGSPGRFCFPPEVRVRLRRDFEVVYAAETRKRIGPFVVHAAKSPVGHARIGFGIPRRFGPAPRRNLMRRRLREAFRHMKSELPPLDLVVHVRPHDPVASVERCQAMLRDAACRLAGRLADQP
ncbi:MAG: ribonuclease P protein component [Phycisphaerales bacterium]